MHRTLMSLPFLFFVAGCQSATGHGLVEIDELRFGSGERFLGAAAEFTADEIVDSTRCERIPFGECDVVRCADAEPRATTFYSAGSLTVRTHGEAVDLETGALDLLEPLDAGTPVVVDASGGDVPAFETTVEAPGPPTLGLPERLVPGDDLTIELGTLAPRASRAVRVSVFRLFGPPEAAIECHPLGDTLVVRAELLAALDPDEAVTVSVSATATEVVDAGGFEVAVRVRQELVDVVAR